MTHRRLGETIHTRRRGDRGGATVWLLGAGLLTVAFGVAIAGVGAAVVARHQAQAAADLGALAGAMHALEGEDVACRHAAEIVAANGGRLTACLLSGFDVLVTAEVAPSGYAALAGTARASARAGPAAPHLATDLGEPAYRVGDV